MVIIYYLNINNINQKSSNSQGLNAYSKFSSINNQFLLNIIYFKI